MMRVGVIVTALGKPSEIWMRRQCLGFQQIEPVLFAWKRAREAVPIPRQFETHFFPRQPTGLRRLVARAGKRIGRKPSFRPTAAERGEIRATLEAARLDAILCHFGWNAAPVLSSMDGAHSPSVVVHFHGSDIPSNQRRRAELRRVLPGAAGVVTVARFQIEMLRELGLPRNHHLIPCGAPLDLFARAPIPERAVGTRLRFISVGRLSEEKGFLQSLSAFEEVVARHPEAEWVVIGAGPLAEPLASAAARGAARGRVHLRGWMAAEDVARELAAAHVFVQHSRAVGEWLEGCAVSITEGAAAGLPVVASALGGNPDQIEHGVNGFLHQPDDVREQARLMLLLAGDEALRRRMGGEARRVAMTFDSREMTRKLERVLLDVMADRAGGAGDTR